jgi:splicing factor 3A subunit 3
LNINNRKEYTEKHKEIARIEAKVYRLSEILGSQRSNTIENVQRKQALTPGEREQEEDADIINDDSDDDEDDGTFYNPKNLPLGWDGKVKLYTTIKL